MASFFRTNVVEAFFLSQKYYIHLLTPPGNQVLLLESLFEVLSL
jgi:hypothetical protein